LQWIESFIGRGEISPKEFAQFIGKENAVVRNGGLGFKSAGEIEAAGRASSSNPLKIHPQRTRTGIMSDNSPNDFEQETSCPRQFRERANRRGEYDQGKCNQASNWAARFRSRSWALPAASSWASV
jgi:hypothetical protein